MVKVLLKGHMSAKKPFLSKKKQTKNKNAVQFHKRTHYMYVS